MWFLKSLQSDTVYYIRPDIPRHTVSRSKGHLIIKDDPSISRDHAFLCPEADSLKLIDAGSRYGTFLNYAIESDREEIPKDVPVRLNQGDRIRFGKCQSLWSVERVEFNCITSTVTAEEREQLKETLRKLGGTVDDGFKEGRTNFLVMNTIITTPKLLMCLTAQVPVVTATYLEDCTKAVASGLALPDPDDFIPEFTESYVRGEGITFKRVAARETLFNGKQFVFINPPHMAQFEAVIKRAGGKCLCVRNQKISKSFFTKPNVVVIQPATSASLSQTSSKTVDQMAKIVADAGKRLIPDADIGLAILNCSLEKYCNPLYKFSSVLDLESVPLSHGEMLAKSSEGPPQQDVPLKESISIPETESADISQQSEFTANNDCNLGEKLSDAVPEGSDSSRGKRKHSDLMVSPKESKKLRSVPKARDVSPSKELEIPETPSNQPSSQAQMLSQLSGFLSVNHDEPPEPPKETSTQKRPLNLMLDDGEEDLFNFGKAPPKRTRRQPTLAESFSASQSSQKTSSNQNDDLFSFGEGTSKRSKRRNAEQSSETLVPKSTTAEDTTGIGTSTTYRQFIRPIQIPTEGWLSASLSELKFETQDNEEEQKSTEDDGGVETSKIKEEPNDEDQKTRVWINGMEAMFQVRVKCMNLTSHHPRPGRQNDGDGSFFCSANASISVNGGKNFKAFVKKRNYKPQQTIIKTMPVCVLDNTQDDHF